ncbi:hypothetical protein E2C01_013562 [Portunus trituberculatus]|uniref:Uncharacterized protein n=1 Tax=Portunus trituberculatus TaxID=210409 RepID=A0A5B7DHL9_PORTR|nr:hypothetical protein [Portunus trituberculatus]
MVNVSLIPTDGRQLVRAGGVGGGGGGMFLIFAKVQPVQCSTNDTQFPIGTCLTSHDCNAKGGVRSSSCASGLGVCCISKHPASIRHPPLRSSFFTLPDGSLFHRELVPLAKDSWGK